MTTSTVHKFGILELDTIKVECRSCKRRVLVEVESWSCPANGQLRCPLCMSDWGADGEALAGFVASLQKLQEKPRRNRPPVPAGRVQTTQITVEFEITQRREEVG